MGHLQIQEPWFPSDMELHINKLELGTIRLPYMTFLLGRQNSIVHIFKNLMTAMPYINKKGGGE